MTSCQNKHLVDFPDIYLILNAIPLDMADVDDGVKPDLVVTGAANPGGEKESTAVADDDAIIPRGEIDPVYEAKARVLNRAVGGSKTLTGIPHEWHVDK